MPILSNSRYELFAQEMAKGVLSPEAAYAAAGFKAHRQNAHRLMTHDDVMRRIEELRGRAEIAASSSLNVTLQWLMEKAEEARSLAMTNGQPSAAVAALKELGVLSGHRVERRENTNKDASSLTDDELADIARAGGNHSVETESGAPKPH